MIYAPVQQQQEDDPNADDSATAEFTSDVDIYMAAIVT